MDAVPVVEPVDVGDARVVECCKHLSLATKARQSIRLVREQLRQDLDRNVALQARVASTIDLAHPAGAKRAEHFVVAESSVNGQRHEAAVESSTILAATTEPHVGIADTIDGHPANIMAMTLRLAAGRCGRQLAQDQRYAS